MVAKNKAKIVVIGGGLQGSSVALALASRGYCTTLVEKEFLPMQAASLRNEGKIHLGFIYALDKSGNTRKLMLKGALSFARLLESWCGTVPWNKCKSENFRYANMPDSLLDAEQLEQSYSKLSEELLEVSDSLKHVAEYFGVKLSWLWRKSAEVVGRPIINGQLIPDYYETEEISIDPRSLAEFVNCSINNNKNITLNCNTNVLSAARNGSGFRLQIESNGKVTDLDADLVVNCAWNDRLRLDQTIGLNTETTEHSYRVKYQILVKPQSINHLKAISLVQGPYGDIVPWQDGLVYISWYPTGRTYFSALPPPPLTNDSEQAQKIAELSLAALANFFPALRGSDIISSLPGIIIARGEQDVDKYDSGLHERNKVGTHGFNGWWSVDTGKLTTAPLFAEQTAQEIEREII
jgi:glycine/D-amino acid oxidase-like deaminating enzyme